PLGDVDLQDSGGRGRHDVAGLVGLELEEGLARLDRVPVGLEPTRQDPLRDRLADSRHGDWYGGHCQRTPGWSGGEGVASTGWWWADTRCGRAAPMAAWTSSACSRSCTACEPVAVLALASRPTYWNGIPISSCKRGATNVQPPMFCDSSWTQ